MRNIKLFSRVLFCLFVVLGIMTSCASAPEKRNSEISVKYKGQVVHRAGGIYLDAKTFQSKLRKLKQDKKVVRIIISAEWCAPCKFLEKELKRKNLLEHVLYLNIDDPWVAIATNGVAKKIGVKQLPIPIMIVEKLNGKNYIFQGPSQIIMHLIYI